MSVPSRHQFAPIANEELAPNAAKRPVAEVRKHDNAADKQEQNREFVIHRLAFSEASP
jgi:hypothetical protein